MLFIHTINCMKVHHDVMEVVRRGKEVKNKRSRPAKKKRRKKVIDEEPKPAELCGGVRACWRTIRQLVRKVNHRIAKNRANAVFFLWLVSGWAGQSESFHSSLFKKN